MDRLVTHKSVIVTSEGNKLVEAGDIITEDIAASQEIESLSKVKGPQAMDSGSEWDSGRPYNLVMGGIKKQIVNARKNNRFGDMDAVLPSKILARRKRLVLDRMRQERNR